MICAGLLWLTVWATIYVMTLRRLEDESMDLRPYAEKMADPVWWAEFNEEHQSIVEHCVVGRAAVAA